MVEQAQRRVEGFNSIKGEFDEDMAIMREILDRVRGKVRANALNGQNLQGLLTSDLNDYLQCLEVNHRDFE